MPSQIDFATWLGRHLEGAEGDLTGLAARAGISQAYLSMLRQGTRTNPSRKVVEALATAVGAPVAEALKAAGLTVRQRGALILPNQSPAGPGDALPVPGQRGWVCQVEIGGLSLSAEVRPVGVNQFHMHVRVTPVGTPAIHREHEAVIAPGAKVAFTLRCGEQDFHCELGEGEKELVLRIPLGLSNAPGSYHSAGNSG